jgi:Tfp pilus assembly protein PilV
MNRQRGFSLTFVIIALILVGVAMSVLAAGSNVMLFHADKAYLQALERNLTASGLAWVRAKASANASDLPVGASVELDVSAFGASAVKLAVQVLEVQDGKARVRIETSCNKRGRARNATNDYTLPIP